MKDFIHTFFAGLGIAITSLEIREEKEDIFIRVETPDSPLLIGIHGKNIESFQHIISRIAEKKMQKFMHVHIEVNDYMKAKDDRLFAFLESKISWILQSGKPIQIRNLSSFERKKAHNYIGEKNIAGLGTKSEGESENRVLILTYEGPLTPGVTPHQHVIPERQKTSDLDLLSENGVGI